VDPNLVGERWITWVVRWGVVVSCMVGGMQVGIVAVVVVVAVVAVVEEVAWKRRIGNVECRLVWGLLVGL
jgi:hypothetical protein